MVGSEGKAKVFLREFPEKSPKVPPWVKIACEMTRIAIALFASAAIASASQPPGTPVPAAAQVAPAPPQAAVKVLGLFDQLRAAEAANGRGGKQQVSFRLTDAEINQYMVYSLKAVPRPGLQSVTVNVQPANYISTVTIIDFDAVERWHPGTVPAALRLLLTGKKSILVDYRISAHDSKLTFSVEKAAYQDVRVPAFVVEKVIGILAARQPEKYDTGKPMAIPFGLRNVWTSNHGIEGKN